MTSIMSRIWGAIAPYALPLLALGIAALVVWQQERVITSNKAAMSAYQTIAERAEALAVLLERSSRAAAENSIKMQRDQDEIRAALSQREIDIGAMQNEVAEIRDWATTVLPAGVAGLRARPAISGSAEYREYVSRRNGLHTAGGKPEDERRHDPRH